MTPSLSKSEKRDIMAFIKNNRRNFYKALWKWYALGELVLSGEKNLVIGQGLRDYSDDYQYISQLNAIYLALTNGVWKGNVIGGAKTFIMIEYVHKKYMARFYKYYYHPKCKKQVPPPRLKYTDALREFLARGFVHKADAIDYRGKKYTVEAWLEVAPLIWPQAYDQHGEACKQQAKIGIRGFTKAAIPK
jgi:hypothetical protein